MAGRSPEQTRLERTRDELTAFLRHHRSKLSPADVGLPSTGRRRTAGLRREEVAALAGVGLTWYTWFEQGREIGVSEDFLLRVSKALRLDDAECCHLFLLAQRRPPPLETYAAQTVRPLVQRLMDDLDERPAYVINLRWDVIAWNPPAQRLFDFERHRQAERNLLRMLFADPTLRRRLPAWREEAPRLLAQFRCDRAAAPDDPAWNALVADLEALSPDFRRWWATPVLEGYALGPTVIADAAGRTLRFEHEVLIADEHRHLRMVVYFS